MSREEDLKKAEALLEEAKREALRLQKTNPEVAGEDLNRINNDFIELKEIQEDVNKIKEAEANNKLTPAKAKSILKKTGKFLRKVAHFTEKGNKDKNVSDGFKGLMGKVDFETKMANLNPYEQMIENLKEGNWKDYTKIDYFHDLIKILKETDNIHVRLNAISTLRNIGDSAIIPLCDEIERTEDKGMLYCYIDILRLIDLDKTDKTKINRVIDALIYALEKIKDDEKECNTILVIFSYMGKPALPKLKKVLNNCSDEVKRYIYEAIRRIDPENYLAFKEVNEFKNQFFEKIDKFKTPNILRDVQISPPKEVPDINNCVRYNFNYFEYRKDEKTKEVKKILGKSAGRSVIYEPFFKYFEYSIKNFVGDAGKSFLEEMTHIRSVHHHIDEMEINPDPLSQIKVWQKYGTEIKSKTIGVDVEINPITEGFRRMTFMSPVEIDGEKFYPNVKFPGDIKKYLDYNDFKPAMILMENFPDINIFPPIVYVKLPDEEYNLYGKKRKTSPCFAFFFTPEGRRIMSATNVGTSIIDKNYINEVSKKCGKDTTTIIEDFYTEPFKFLAKCHTSELYLSTPTGDSDAHYGNFFLSESGKIFNVSDFSYFRVSDVKLAIERDYFFFLTGITYLNEKFKSEKTEEELIEIYFSEIEHISKNYPKLKQNADKILSLKNKFGFMSKEGKKIIFNSLYEDFSNTRDNARKETIDYLEKNVKKIQGLGDNEKQKIIYEFSVKLKNAKQYSPINTLKREIGEICKSYSNQQITQPNLGTDTSIPTPKEFETIVSSDGKELSEEGKKVNSLVYNALYSDDQRRQNAINELKQIKNKDLVKQIYKKHRQYSWGKSGLPEYKDNFAQVRKLIGINPTVKSDILDKQGRLKKEINVGTLGDLPNDVFEKTAPIIQKIEEAEKLLDEVEEEPSNNSDTE